MLKTWAADAICADLKSLQSAAIVKVCSVPTLSVTGIHLKHVHSLKRASVVASIAPTSGFTNFKGKGDVDMIIAILWLISVYLALGLVWVAFTTITVLADGGSLGSWSAGVRTVFGWPYHVWAVFHPRARNPEAAWISIATLICMAFFVLLVVQPAHS
jgi:hypothetical protein